MRPVLRYAWGRVLCRLFGHRWQDATQPSSWTRIRVCTRCQPRYAQRLVLDVWEYSAKDSIK